ncbi:MAG: DUF4831 family protein [Paludibacter sp.]
MQQNDLSGAPYYISLRPQTINSVQADSKPVVGLNYVLPAATDVVIGDGINPNFSGQFYIPQFGKVVSLPEGLFKQRDVKVHIDSQTGRLLSIE